MPYGPLLSQHPSQLPHNRCMRDASRRVERAHFLPLALGVQTCSWGSSNSGQGLHFGSQQKATDEQRTPGQQRGPTWKPITLPGDWVIESSTLCSEAALQVLGQRPGSQSVKGICSPCPAEGLGMIGPGTVPGLGTRKGQGVSRAWQTLPLLPMRYESCSVLWYHYPVRTSVFPPVNWTLDTPETEAIHPQLSAVTVSPRVRRGWQSKSLQSHWRCGVREAPNKPKATKPH